MPPKKKGSGRKTNKKNGSNSNNAGGGSGMRAPNANNNDPAKALKGALPDMSGFERRNPIQPENYPTTYQRYKDATKRFFDYMKKQAHDVLPGIGGTLSVNSLVAIADQMRDDGNTIDPMALKDLKLSIRIRSRVAKSVFGGGDSGHQYILTVLNYCWTILVTLPRVATQDYDIMEREGSSRQENRFDLFQEDVDDEELDNTDVEVFPTYVPRPKPLPESMSLEDLMKSDERHDALLFLLSLNEIMDAVVQQYRGVCRVYQQNEARGFPPSVIAPKLIEASVATNMGIQQVQRLEMDLCLQYPHLTTPYRLLATVVLPEITNDLIGILRDHAAKPFTPKDAIIFLGDCLECAFRNVSDPHNRAEFIAPEFCTTHRVDVHGTEKILNLVEGLRITTMLEVPLACESRLNEAIVSLILRQAPSYHSHNWLSTVSMPHISGGRSIHHTIRLLQTFGDVISSTGAQNQAEAIRGCFGPDPWVQGKSSKIAGDMDELLMADILPKFILMFRHGILGKAVLPMVDEIAPLWMHIRNYVRHPEKAVSWSLVFSVHALLTSILETDQITDSLMSSGETMFQGFFNQVESAKTLLRKEPDSTLLKDFRFCLNITVVLSLQNLGLPVFGTRSIWNPLYAGTTFSYLSFFGSMEAGCSVVDGRAQLRFVMFLYHGLLLNGIIKSGEIPFLDIMYASFKNSRAVWEGTLPCRGELVQRFWICHGLNLVNSKKMSDEAQEIYAYGKFSSSGRSDKVAGAYLGRSRKMSPIQPEEISKSYRRICNRDFHDVVDNYHTPEQQERGKHSDAYMMAVRINDTLDAIDEERPLLSLNLIACSIVLEQFVCSLARVMQWDPLIQSFIKANPNLKLDYRQGALHMFAQHLLAALDFSSHPIDHEFLHVPLGLASSSFLVEFFTRLNPGGVVWFSGISEQE